MGDRIRVIAFDVDGTLTDGTTWYAGDELGWAQRYSVRDGEAILRLVRRGLVVLPISRNKTAAARRRVELLGLETRWLGVDDKLAALAEVERAHAVSPAEVCFIGDGPDDVPLLARAGAGVAVADAHSRAKAAAAHVLAAEGGRHALEELETWLEETSRI